jgi:hypothetical protein
MSKSIKIDYAALIIGIFFGLIPLIVILVVNIQYPETIHKECPSLSEQSENYCLSLEQQLEHKCQSYCHPCFGEIKYNAVFGSYPKSLSIKCECNCDWLEINISEIPDSAVIFPPTIITYNYINESEARAK